MPENVVLAFPPETDESKAQAVREQSTFAAVYTSLTHIPPSPAEPNEVPNEYPDAHVVHIPLEDVYAYSGPSGPAQAISTADPTSVNSLLAATNSVLQSLNGHSQQIPQIPTQPVAPPPAPDNSSASVDLSLVGGLLSTPGYVFYRSRLLAAYHESQLNCRCLSSHFSLVQSLLGLMGGNSNTSSLPVAASSPTNTLSLGRSAPMSPPSSWQSHSAPPPPPPPQQQPSRQSYGYYPASSSAAASQQQQYNAPSRNAQYGNNQSYSGHSYSVS